jgi:o-succinylbenzoate synthase
MAFAAQYYKHTLNFRFDAGTSRGVLRNKDSYFLKIYKKGIPEIFGIGEAGPLKGLSIDFGEKAENKIQEIVNKVNSNENELEFEKLIESLDNFPSVRFALETALLDLKNAGKRLIFENDFYQNEKPISINGLVWMGSVDFMQKQIREKIEAGFDTIKLKIAALGFEEELEIIKKLRKEFSPGEITLRVDANGGFSKSEALEKLKRLSEFSIHSIEQPIEVKQLYEMADLCQKSPIPIALDEELINPGLSKEDLLLAINPQYIILKPSLMGGVSGSREWINLAEKNNIKWWLTSALESNIGLNAVCQLAEEYPNNLLPQGLGTGQLFHNNFDSPLTVENGKIRYRKDLDWNLEYFK